MMFNLIDSKLRILYFSILICCQLNYYKVNILIYDIVNRIYLSYYNCQNLYANILTK